MHVMTVMLLNPMSNSGSHHLSHAPNLFADSPPGFIQSILQNQGTTVHPKAAPHSGHFNEYLSPLHQLSATGVLFDRFGFAARKGQPNSDVFPGKGGGSCASLVDLGPASVFARDVECMNVYIYTHVYIGLRYCVYTCYASACSKRGMGGKMFHDIGVHFAASVPR